MIDMNVLLLTFFTFFLLRSLPNVLGNCLRGDTSVCAEVLDLIFCHIHPCGLKSLGIVLMIFTNFMLTVYLAVKRRNSCKEELCKF